MSEEEGHSWEDFIDFVYEEKNLGIEINSLFRSWLTEKIGNPRRHKYRKEVLKY